MQREADLQKCECIGFIYPRKVKYKSAFIMKNNCWNRRALNDLNYREYVSLWEYKS